MVYTINIFICTAIIVTIYTIYHYNIISVVIFKKWMIVIVLVVEIYIITS